MWAFSSCGEWELLSGCVLLTAVASLGAEHRPLAVVALGLVVSQYVESSWARDQTCVPCIGRQILNHWTTKVLSFLAQGPLKIMSLRAQT